MICTLNLITAFVVVVIVFKVITKVLITLTRWFLNLAFNSYAFCWKWWVFTFDKWSNFVAFARPESEPATFLFENIFSLSKCLGTPLFAISNTFLVTTVMASILRRPTKHRLPDLLSTSCIYPLQLNVVSTFWRSINNIATLNILHINLVRYF